MCAVHHQKSAWGVGGITGYVPTPSVVLCLLISSHGSRDYGKGACVILIGMCSKKWGTSKYVRYMHA